MDELQKLYDVLTRDGYYTKSFDDFKVQFQDPGYQDKVYGVVERDGLFTKGKDAFIQKYTSQAEPIAVKKKRTVRTSVEPKASAAKARTCTPVFGIQAFGYFFGISKSS